MSSFLFLTWDGGGNVPPAVGIAAELHGRGHAVRFLGHEGNRPAMAAATMPFRSFDHALPFTSRVVNGPERMVEVFNDAGVARDLLLDSDREPTDVVVIDPLMLAALAAVHGSGLTYVPLVHLFYAYLRDGWLRGPFGQVAEQRGYAPYDALDDAPLTLIASLAHGLPLAVMPMHPMLDQPLVGKAVQEAGAGRLLQRDARPREIRTVLEELLADGAHRAAAARLAQLIRETDGTTTAADRLEELLTRAPAGA